MLPLRVKSKRMAQTSDSISWIAKGGTSNSASRFCFVISEQEETKMLNQKLGHGCFVGNACHRPWDLGNMKGQNGPVITSRYKLSSEAFRKDGILKKVFRVKVASALLGHKEAEAWLEERGCALVRA